MRLMRHVDAAFREMLPFANLLGSGLVGTGGPRLDLDRALGVERQVESLGRVMWHLVKVEEALAQRVVGGGVLIPDLDLDVVRQVLGQHAKFERLVPDGVEVVVNDFGLHNSNSNSNSNSNNMNINGCSCCTSMRDRSINHTLTLMWPTSTVANGSDLPNMSAFLRPLAEMTLTCNRKCEPSCAWPRCDL
jgi:hypothetical protein